MFIFESLFLMHKHECRSGLRSFCAAGSHLKQTNVLGACASSSLADGWGLGFLTVSSQQLLQA